MGTGYQRGQNERCPRHAGQEDESKISTRTKGKITKASIPRRSETSEECDGFEQKAPRVTTSASEEEECTLIVDQ